MKRVLSLLNEKSKTKQKEASKRRVYPRTPEEYQLLEECGSGATGSVWKAVCPKYKEAVAVKQVNLETVQAEVETFVSEAQMMSQLHHPNLLPLYCSFLHKQSLWMVMPFVSGGSLQQILKDQAPTGLSEMFCCTILHETLKGLLYLHKHGIIHRDIKAGNVLLGQDGSVWLADFGIAATTKRTSSWGKSGNLRNTFAGSICWMAPEVIASEEYDESADIWSLGMTALELAYGLPPNATMAPMKIMMTVMRDDPPQLEDKDDRVFSKLFKDFVANCLQKEPRDRATCEQLLQHKWFKTARTKEFIQNQLLATPDAEMRSKENKLQVSQSLEQIAQIEANNVSTWNFNLTCLQKNLPGQSPVSSPMGAPSDTEETMDSVFAAPDARPGQDVKWSGSPMLVRRQSTLSSTSLASSTDALSVPQSTATPHGVDGSPPEWDMPEGVLPLPPSMSMPNVAAAAMRTQGSAGSTASATMHGRVASTQSLQNLRVHPNGGGIVVGGNVNVMSTNSAAPARPKHLSRSTSDLSHTTHSRTMLQSSQVAIVAERRRQTSETIRLQQQQHGVTQQRGRFMVVEESQSYQTGMGREGSGPPRLTKSASMRHGMSSQQSNGTPRRNGSVPAHNIVIQGRQ